MFILPELDVPLFNIGGILIETEGQNRVGRPKKIKKAKFGPKQFKKGQILKNEKRSNKGQISFKKLLK
jgi:hypothetical protein